ncbi:hypothetical protein B0A49_00255 [Cryomyces minteri]|uniref:CAP-Gly domain-containing protein n=1 Tax=Cryomyces minteri TaxID=331657 RepID=A0A4U0XZ98_9PEZI|nr:hypothetical protein B0A49_00255 [Cryomyces minteri]
MAHQTPRRLGRPSLNGNINTASSPNLNLSASTSKARKASWNALTGTATPVTPASRMTGEEQGLELGDNVDVPGDMHGIVKFIGSVKGKKGQFIGVELSREFAARGKNDGDVDG